MSRVTRRRFSLVIAGMIAAAPRLSTGIRPLAAAAGATYALAELGLIDGTFSYAKAINVNGVVAGTAMAEDGLLHAFTYRDGTVRDLGTRGENSDVFDINTRRWVAGYLGYPGSADSPRTARAVLWQAGKAVELGTLGGGTSMALALNDAGDTVGLSALTPGDGAFDHAFLWQDGEMADLGTVGGDWSRANDVNAKNWIVGAATTTAGGLPSEAGSHATLWREGEATDLGTLGGEISTAEAVSAGGTVVGASTTASDQDFGASGTRAFAWNDGELIALITPDDAVSYAIDVNSGGQIVGYVSKPAGDGESRLLIPALWEPDGALIELIDQFPAEDGWAGASAQAINDAGQIAGVGINDGLVRGFLLTLGGD